MQAFSMALAVAALINFRVGRANNQHQHELVGQNLYQPGFATHGQARCRASLAIG
jgi:hypothetical protein